ncbi:hypothetical protein KIL84_022788 [Mauremys mutica]|uniref:Uncharacterized protein n=1 Tax=Mauremys mutica TaxID=74926 RepID=A0A9D3WNY1_9SAUR|nr:hypothetical protein KIL84_022788 [Mauremys mutica]
MKGYWIRTKISGLPQLPFQLIQNAQIVDIRCHLKDLFIFMLIWLHHWWLLHPMSDQKSLGNLPLKRKPNTMHLFGREGGYSSCVLQISIAKYDYLQWDRLCEFKHRLPSECRGEFKATCEEGSLLPKPLF